MGEPIDGRAYLQNLIDYGLRGKPTDLDPAEIREIALELVAAGALGQEEMEDILYGLEEQLCALGRVIHVHLSASSPPGPPTPMPIAREGSTPDGLTPEPMSEEARRRLVLDSAADWRQRPPVVDPPKLRRVISLGGRPLTIGDAEASLLTLESWSTRFALRLAIPDPDGRRARDPLGAAGERWHAWDDVATRYRRRGGTGSGALGLYVSEFIFEPGVPDQARTLTLRVDHDGGTECLTIDLHVEEPD